MITPGCALVTTLGLTAVALSSCTAGVNLGANKSTGVAGAGGGATGLGPGNLGGGSSIAGAGGPSPAGSGGTWMGGAAGAPGVVETVCGFVMPSPASAGLPNSASYDTSTPGIVVDRVTGLEWERSLMAAPTTALDAGAYCAANRLGGYSDWRLPNVIELASLLDTTVAAGLPLIDATAFPATPASNFWTSVPLAGKQFRDHWFVGFGGQVAAFTDQDITLDQVRCVRSGASRPLTCLPSNARYQPAGDSVADGLTGLAWQRAVSPGRLSFADARAYCAGLDGGFRLPTVNELLTLVDFSVAQTTAPTPPMIDALAFPETPAEVFWTSSVPQLASVTAYTVNFANGQTVIKTSMSAPPDANVRCVH